jgi:hypothetical protein
MLNRKKWRNILMNAEAYNPFSDHSIACAKLKLTLRVPNHTRKTKYYRERFSSSTDIQAMYTMTVKNWFQLLEEEGKSGYSTFVEAKNVSYGRLRVCQT